MSYPVFYVPAGDVLPVMFGSYVGSTGASVTLTGLAVTDIEIYKDGSTTQRASDAGYTLLDTDGIDFDAITGIHGFSIDTGDNTDAGFYTVGAWFTVVVSAVTVDSQTVSFIACQFRLMAAESIAAKPKVDVDAWLGTAAATPTTGGVPEVDITHITGSAVSTSTAQLGVNAVQAGGTAWGSGAITAASIAADAITAAKVADGAIDALTFAAGAIDATAIANGAIDAATFAAGAIDAAAIATGAIDADAVADNAIDAGAIATGALTAAKFAAGAIDAAALAADAGTEITNSVLAGEITELASIPGASPTLEQALAILYMALRNKRDTTSTADEIHNDAGTVIATATLSDDGTTFTKAEYA